MSRLQTFPLPDVGEGLTEAEILEWKVAEGDTVAVNQIIVEIETAKAAVELPSPHAGRVHRLLAEIGVTIEVGTPIIEIDTDPDAGPLDSGADGGAAGGYDGPAEAAQAAPVAGAPAAAGPGGAAGGAGSAGAGDSGSAGDAGGAGAGGASGGATAGAATVGGSGGAKIGEAMADGRVQTLVGITAPEGGSARRARRGSGPVSSAVGVPGGAPAPRRAPTAENAPLATPPVRKLAKDLGIDLAAVTASRADGVISRADVEAAAGRAAVDSGPAPLHGARPQQRAGAVVMQYDPASRERREPIKGVRKQMAAAMVESAFTAPHVTEFLSVDVTPMMELRERLRGRRDWAGVKLSPLTFAARAVCLAARHTPEVNCTWDEAAGEVIFKEYVHLGIAAATPRGLVVPVIRDADQRDLRGLAEALVDLTDTARAGRTSPADMTGGTITITNVGVLGVDTGTPIINPGQSAILALGSVKDAPWVVDGELAVRKVCQLALSFDHRVVDGEKGSRFLAEVGGLLADPALALTY